MKRTEIDYHVVDGEYVHVTGIRNVATYDDIENEFGLAVKQAYKEGFPKYRKAAYNDERVTVFHEVSKYLVIKKGLVYDKKEFGVIISAMRAAGERLLKIRKEIKTSEQKTIKI